MVPTESTWNLTVFCSYRIESVTLSTKSETFKISDTLLFNDLDISYLNGKLIIKKDREIDTVYKTIKINPLADVVTIKVAFSSNYYRKDSVIFGNLPNAIFPSLGGTRTYHCSNIINPYFSKRWLTEDGKPNTNGVYVKGRVYNADNSLINEKEVLLINNEFYPSFSEDVFQFKTSSDGSYFTSADCWMVQLTSVSIHDKQYSIKPFTLTGKCGDTIQADIYLTEYVAVAESQAAQKFSITCANKTLTMQYQLSHAAQLTVYNAQGQIVAQQNVDAQTNSANVAIDGLSAGVYFCTLSNAVDGLESLRFVVD